MKDKIAPSLHIEKIKPLRSKLNYPSNQEHSRVDKLFSNILEKHENKGIYSLIEDDSALKDSDLGSTIGPMDFDIVEFIGFGNLGKVFKVKYKEDNMIYAMKTCKKSRLKESKQKEHALNERRILGNISHPFIVNLKYSFQTDTKLYIIMEYLSGGELFFHMKKVKYFSEKTAKFFLAQMFYSLYVEMIE